MMMITIVIIQLLMYICLQCNSRKHSSIDYDDDNDSNNAIAPLICLQCNSRKHSSIDYDDDNDSNNTIAPLHLFAV